MGSSRLSSLPLRWIFLIAGAGLTALAFPGPLAADGWGFLAWFSLVPVFFFIQKSRWLELLLGSLAYSLVFSLITFQWLASFHPLGLILATVFFCTESLVLFVLLKAAVVFFPRRGFWVQALVWVGWEFLRTQGFLGCPYGALSATQAFYPVVIQSAEGAGVWFLTFLLAWTNAYLSSLAANPMGKTLVPHGVAGSVLLLANLAWGIFVLSQPDSSDRFWKPALVQHDQDPWKGGEFAYEEGLDKLLALSATALADKPDAVVWSETAFVPSVFFHEKYRENADSYRLVRRLEDFLQTQKIPYLIGNDHREKITSGGRERVADWNAVLLWNGGWKGIYKKTRLVPFTESFPYKETFPWFYQFLLDNDTHFWEPGTDVSPLDVGAVKVGTPICFEDAFPDPTRQMVAGGAQVIVNLTNDSWSSSPAAMDQHLGLAVFRAVENRRSLVRCANGGATVAIDPRGQILSRLEENKPGILSLKVPLHSSQTLYNREGDWLAYGALVLAAAALVTGGCLTLGKISNFKKS